MKRYQGWDKSGVETDTSALLALCHSFWVTLHSDALQLSGESNFQKLSDVSGCKAQLKPSTNGKSCPSVSPDTSGFALTSLRLTCSALILSSPFICTCCDHLVLWQTIASRISAWLHDHGLRKKTHQTSLKAEGRDWTQANNSKLYLCCAGLLEW